VRTNKRHLTESERAKRRAALNLFAPSAPPAPRSGKLAATPAARLAARSNPTIGRYALRPEPVTKSAPTVTSPTAAPSPPPRSSPTAAEIATARRVRNREIFERVHAILLERYPQIFSCARPLAVGIHRELFAALDGEYSHKSVARYLNAWTTRADYRAALAAGVRRIHLDGEDAGPAFGDPLPEATK
jgi:hypothetical protein